VTDAVIKITADTANAQAGLRRLGDSVNGVGRHLMDLSSLAGTLGGALSVSAFATFIKSTVDSIDALNDLADATGASIENLSALEHIAMRTGTSVDTVGAALVKFNQTLEAAKPGSGAEQALKAIGLSADELKKLDPAEALRQTAVALAGFADDGNKARLVQELFGKSVREVAPLLKDLAEGGELVAKVTKQQAEEAEKFNKELFQLKANITDVSRSLTSDLITSINATIAKFREGSQAGKGFFATAASVYWGNVRKIYGIEDKPEAKPEGSWGEPDEMMGPPAPGKGDRPSVGAMADPAALKKAAEEAARLRAQDLAGWVKYAEAVLAEGERVDAIRNKQIEDDNKAQADKTAKLLEAFNTGNQTLAEAVAQQDLTEAERIQFKADAEMARLEEQRILIMEQNAWTLQMEADFEQAQLDLKARANAAFLALDKQKAQQQQQVLVGSLATISSLMSSSNEGLFRVGQAASIAQATISTYEGATKALSYGPILGPVLAAGIIAAGLANVAQIASTKIGGGTPSPVNATFSGGSVDTGTTPSPITAPITAPNATLAAPRQQVNLTFSGSGRYTYDEVVNGIIPLLQEGVDNGVDINVVRA